MTQKKPPKSPKQRRARRRMALAGLVVLVGAVIAVTVLRKGEAVLTVQTEKVQRRDITETVVATGRIHPVSKVVINPEVSGEIVGLAVREGQLVTKGDLLLRIKPDNYIASRNSSEASYKSSLAGQALAAANLARAEFEFKHAETMYGDGLISESEYVGAKTSFDVATASLESSRHQTDQANAALERAEEELAKTTIVAPMDGTVTQLRSEVGERVVGTAMMAGTEIMTIANLAAMEAWVDIGEIDIVSIQIDQKATLEVDAFRDESFSGKVSEIANAAKTSGMGSQQEATKFEVKIRIDDQAAFRPGMSVTANVETQYRTNVLAVPIQSVTTRLPKTRGKSQPPEDKDAGQPDNGEPAGADPTSETDEEPKQGNEKDKKKRQEAVEVVFAVEEGRAKMVRVERGISDDDYTEIISGLEDGMEIVSGGYRAISRDLEDDKAVRVGPATGPEDDSDEDK